MGEYTYRIIDLCLLVFSFTVHEVAHAITADKFGDSTAKDAGRITLNPLAHIDPIASIIMPLLVGIGAAKPVPVQFEFLRPRRLGMIMVSFAGPFSNFIMAVVFALIIKVGIASDFATMILERGILLNLILGIFNLIPIPPLDGSKIVLAFFPEHIQEKVLRWENYGFMVLIILVLLGAINTIVMPIFNAMLRVFAIFL